MVNCGLQSHSLISALLLRGERPNGIGVVNDRNKLYKRHNLSSITTEVFDATSANCVQSELYKYWTEENGHLKAT